MEHTRTHPAIGHSLVEKNLATREYPRRVTAV
jgi:hypothetical protein